MDMKPITPLEALRRKDDPELPFQKEVRVACPMKHFALRQTFYCLECNKFQGVFMKNVVGTLEGKPAEVASKICSIVCAHPISRRLTYIPED